MDIQGLLPYYLSWLPEGDTLDESLENVKDAFVAVMELYQELGRSLPENTHGERGV